MSAYRVAEDPGSRILVTQAGLACCSLEVEAAVARGLLIPDDESGVVDEADSTVLLVAGTVTEAIAPALMGLVASLPPGARIMAFGACATSGGPYWDAPMVLPGIDGLLEVATYVPGCPPRPEALMSALSGLRAST